MFVLRVPAAVVCLVFAASMLLVTIDAARQTRRRGVAEYRVHDAEFIGWMAQGVRILHLRGASRPRS